MCTQPRNNYRTNKQMNLQSQTIKFFQFTIHFLFQFIIVAHVKTVLRKAVK